MLLSGLTSDTFPEQFPRRIVGLAQAAGIEGIEWEGGCHVPLGDTEAARHARIVTEEAGMVVISYGVDEPIEEGKTIEQIVDTAGTLGAEAIRVRAGRQPLRDADKEQRLRVAESLADCVDQAGRQGILVAIGLHPSSLAGSAREAMELMTAARVDSAHVFWHPQHARNTNENLEDLRAGEDAVLGVHCTGVDERAETTMLSETTDRWAEYLEVLRNVDDDHWLCLRGVEGNRVDAFYRDAQTLRRLAARYGGDAADP